MSDETQRQVLLLSGTVTATLIGGGIALLVSFLSDRRKVRGERLNALRAAYARWITTHRVIKYQIESLATSLTEHPETNEAHRLLVQQGKEVLAGLKEEYQALNEVNLLDSDPKRREIVSLATKHVDIVYGGIQGVRTIFPLGNRRF